MKSMSIAAAVVAIVLIVTLLVPETAGYHVLLALVALVAAAVALAGMLVGWKERAEAPNTGSVAAAQTAAVVSGAPPPAAAPARPAPVAAPLPTIPANQAEAEVISFLATMQDRGRLVDFLMDDVAPYSDAQVGAAARVVHDGCQAVLRDYFRISHIRDESEGSKVAVPSEYRADEYRLVGKIAGQAPFAGTLMHRGWKAEVVKLPRVVRTSGGELPTIAPAEVELK